jgi:hypothetical protein
LTNHEAADSLHAATDRDATPPRVIRRPPGQYGLEFRPGVFGSARPTSRLFSAVLDHASLGPHCARALTPAQCVSSADRPASRHATSTALASAPLRRRCCDPAAQRFQTLAAWPLPESQRGAPRLADVIPMRGKHVVDKLSRGLAEAEGKRTGTRKLSGN